MPHFPPFAPPDGTTAADWGLLAVGAKCYAPLAQVELTVAPAATGARSWRVEWYDGLGRRYGVARGEFGGEPAVVRFPAGGAPGMQFARLWLDDRQAPRRLVNWYLEARTRLVTGDAALDAVYPATLDAMRLNRRRYALPEGQVVGYTTADSVQTLAYWLRDMYYNLSGYQLWEHDVTSGFAALFARQAPDGSLPDGVRADGSTWRMITESDVEYLAVLALWRTWLASGDDAWLVRWLPVAERAVEHLRANPLRWHAGHALVVRAHTCDTWDFAIDQGDIYTEATAKVAALCDQTGYYQAVMALAQIYAHLGRRDESTALREAAATFRRRAAELLWDGEKFRHHHHLDPFDHHGFDEGSQLAMSNPWAVTRGLASHEQALRVVEAYRRRLDDTRDAFPWWSLQPGYPHADFPFLRNHPYQHTGGYCNGGLMPWVGGALAHAACLAGQEAWAAELLGDYARFLAERGGEVFTWYWPNGEPGFRTANTTGHDGWAMGHWCAALFEGLAGVEVTGPALSRATVSPRWAATGATAVDCCVALPASETYLAYRWRLTGRALTVELTGVAEKVELRLLLPSEQFADRVWVDGEVVQAERERVGDSRYVVLTLAGDGGVRRVEVRLSA